MSLLLLLIGLIGQWLLGLACAELLRGRRRPRTAEQAPGLDAEQCGMGLVLGIAATGALSFVYSLLGGRLGPTWSWSLTAVGWLAGLLVIVRNLRSVAGLARRATHVGRLTAPDMPQATLRPADGNGDGASFVRFCRWSVAVLFIAALVQALLTPQKLWDERATFALKAAVLYEDGTVHSPALRHPDFVQYHPRYPLLIPLAEQHVYALLGEVNDRWSKTLFPLLYLGMTLTFAGVLQRSLQPSSAWLFALLLAAMPVLMPYEYGFLSAQADAPVACYHGISLLYLWDFLRAANKTSRIGGDFPPTSRSRNVLLGALRDPLQTSLGGSPDRSAAGLARRGPQAGRLNIPAQPHHLQNAARRRRANSAESGGRRRALIAASLSAAAAAFTKDEGLAFLMIDAAALFVVLGFSRRDATGKPGEGPAQGRHRLKAPDKTFRDRLLGGAFSPMRGVWFAALKAAAASAIYVGVASACLAPWLWHRRSLPATTEMDYFSRASVQAFVDGLLTLKWSLPHLARRMFSEWRQWGLQWWCVLAAVLLFPRRAVRREQVLLILDILGSLAALLVAGMLAPTEVAEHIGGSSHRYLMQLAPIAVLLLAGQTGRPRE